MGKKIEKLDEYQLECGRKGYYDYSERDINDVKITESNITAIVSKLNEVIDFINNK